MQDGRGALHRHDLDGRDRDRHHHGWRAPCNEWYRTLQHISIQQQAMQFFAESVCRDNALLDLRLITTKRLMGSACLCRGGKTRASQRKLVATSTSMAPSSMRRRWNKTNHQKKRTSSSTTTMTMLRIPRARAQLLRRQTRRMLRVSALRVRQAPTEGAPASCR